MAYFEWADDLVIDNGPVDKDHRHLVDLVNVLHTATSLGRSQEVISKIMGDLIGYTADHLQKEEQLMAPVNFPDLDRHKMGHAAFTEKLRGLHCVDATPRAGTAIGGHAGRSVNAQETVCGQRPLRHRLRDRYRAQRTAARRGGGQVALGRRDQIGFGEKE